MRCFSIFSPSLSVIPPTFSKKIDPEMRSIAFFNVIGAKFSDQRNLKHADRTDSGYQSALDLVLNRDGLLREVAASGQHLIDQQPSLIRRDFLWFKIIPVGVEDVVANGHQVASLVCPSSRNVLRS